MLEPDFGPSAGVLWRQTHQRDHPSVDVALNPLFHLGSHWLVVLVGNDKLSSLVVGHILLVTNNMVAVMRASLVGAGGFDTSVIVGSHGWHDGLIRLKKTVTV